MNKNQIVNSIRSKILANDEMTANLYTVDGILNPMQPLFSDDLPPVEADPAQDLADNIEAASLDFSVRAGFIKQFVRAEISKITDSSPLDLIDAYNEIVDALKKERPELVEGMVKYPKSSGIGSYKGQLEAFILPPERFLNADGSEIVEPY